MPDASLPVGDAVDFKPVSRPGPEALRGRHVVLRPLNAVTDAAPLYAASHPPAGAPGVWTYLPYGPYPNVEAMGQALAGVERSEDPLFFALVPLACGTPAGVAAYLRAVPEFGVIEIGHIWLGSSLQRTTAATEAIYLLARHVFDQLGYRRLEWKCDALNAASRRAAQRFGFTFEGVFRKHMVVKGRNRDSAWYAIVDDDWARVKDGFEWWLEPGNFDRQGRQRRGLAELRAER